MKIRLKTSLADSPPAPGQLIQLDKTPLTERNQRALNDLAAGAHGSPMWCHRKLAEARDVLVLSQIVPRFRLMGLDMVDSIRVAAELIVPVACMDDPEARGKLIVHDRCLIGVTYSETAIMAPQPGYGFVQILSPRKVFHASVSPRHGQVLCLGATMPRGLPVKEIIRLSYEALAMQSVMLDAADAAGVMNHVAARWWLDNVDRIPLTDQPFTSKPEGN